MVIPVEVFIKNVISVKVIPFSVWRQSLFTELTLQTSDRLKKNEPFTQEEIKQLIETVLDSSLRFSSIIERIQKAASFLSEVEQYSFLKKFEHCYDPQLFWTMYLGLKEEERDFLDPIASITLENNPFEAHKIILQCTGGPRARFESKCQRHVQELINAQSIEEKLQQFTVQFHKGFDRCCPDLIKPPLCFIQPDDIRDTFRMFWAKDKKLSTVLVFNGVKITKPSYNGIEKDDRPNYLFEYLMQEINSRIAESDSPSSEQQKNSLTGPFPFNTEDLSKTCLKFLELDSENSDAMKNITEKFILDLAEYYTTEMNACELTQIMKHYSLFCQQALSSAIKDFPDSTERQVLAFCKAIYPRLLILWRAEKNIPSFRLFQALSISAYTSAVFFMRKSFCPELSVEQAGSYHIKYSPAKPTKYNARFFLKTHAFSVTHVKPYTIFFINEGNKRKKLADVTVHWTLTGNLHENDFSAQFQVAKIQFIDQVLPEQRLEVLNKFQMKWESTPWDNFLSVT